MSATVVGHPPNSELTPGHGSGSTRRPWEFWRSPADQPAWARPALLVTAAVAAVLYAWQLTYADYALFYSDSVKSMSVSWKALLFGALDPGATITPDKIAGSFVPQALSARLFGFHAWSVALPQCIEGVICVLVMYRMVRRWAGPRAGLAAAGALTFTPVVASMFGHSMEDGGLVFCLVLAADCYQRAVLDARLRSLVFAGVWVGVGFQAKMLQAWMILPALALGYLVAAPVGLRRRLGHLLLAGTVCVAVSLSWVLMMTVVPAKDRPYVDGSTNNSAVSMVFGYNGLERFGIHVPGSVPAMGFGGGGGGGKGGAPGRGFGGGARGADAGFGGGAPGAAGAVPSAPGGAAPGGAAPGGGFARPGGAPGGGGGGFPGMNGGWLKLFQDRFGPQVGWLYPFAFLGLAFGLWSRRRAGRTDRLLGGFVMWGTWLTVVGLVFSKMSSIPHTAYMSTLAPAVAALAGTGGVLLWDAYRKGGRAAWLLPVAVAAETAWAWYLGHFTPGFLPWLKWLMLAAAALGVAGMLWGRLSNRAPSRLLLIGLAAGLAGAVVTPVAWSASVLDQKYAGSSFDAGAGPAAGLGSMITKLFSQAGPGGGPGRASGADRTRPGGIRPPAGFGGPGGNISTTLSADQRKLYDYVKTRQDSAKYVLAVDNWTSASPYILATGDTVMPMGGFSGSVPQPSLSHFRSLVQNGQLHFVLLQSGGGLGVLFGGGGSTPVSQIGDWVKQSCTEVPASAFGVSQPPAAADPTGMGAIFGDPDGTGGTLYSCSQ